MNMQANRALPQSRQQREHCLPARHPHTVLAEHDALGLLDPQEQQALLRWSVVRRLDRQETVFRRGDPARSVIVVLAGYVKLSTACPDRDVLLDVAAPGDLIGDVAVLNKRQHQADATTLTHCHILAIDSRQFVQTLERTPEGRLVIVRLLGERLLRATDLVTDALGLPAPARLAKALLRLASLQCFGTGNEGGALRLSQSDLGAMAGIARESANKLLASWRQAGWVGLAHGCVISVDVKALSRVAQGL